MAPACGGACPTHAITGEKVNVDARRADHAAGDAPRLPSVELTLSTTRIELPRDVPADTYAVSDWNLRPEHPHWPLVWLTLLTQLALGVSATAVSAGERLLAAALATSGMAGAIFHLGRPIAAWKALRNLRRSWLSREVALLSLYAALAIGAAGAPVLAVPAGIAGALGVYASARLFVVPGRPAWHTRLTIVRFFATAAALGPVLTGHGALAAAGLGIALAATAANWVRLWRRDEPPWRGAVRLELRWFRPWAVLRWVTGLAGAVLAARGVPIAAFTLLAVSELLGRWLFYVTVVPLNMPGAFWRGAAGSAR
jgi:DMSO reductase anchor subunit